MKYVFSRSPKKSISWWLFVKCIDYFSMGGEYVESELKYKQTKEICKQKHMKTNWERGELKKQTNISSYF